MNNLHKIKNTFHGIVLHDMLLANMWHILKSTNYKIKLNPNLAYHTPAPYGTSPILWTSGGGYIYWYWEVKRLEQWIAAGRPMPDFLRVELHKK